MQEWSWLAACRRLCDCPWWLEVRLKAHHVYRLPLFGNILVWSPMTVISRDIRSMFKANRLSSETISLLFLDLRLDEGCNWGLCGGRCRCLWTRHQISCVRRPYCCWLYSNTSRQSMAREAPLFAVQVDFVVATFTSTSTSLCTSTIWRPCACSISFFCEISYLGSVTFPLVLWSSRRSEAGREKVWSKICVQQLR